MVVIVGNMIDGGVLVVGDVQIAADVVYLGLAMYIRRGVARGRLRRHL